MSDGAIFVAGMIVTLAVAAAMALLIYGAILDGRRQKEYEREHGHAEHRPSGV